MKPIEALQHLHRAQHQLFEAALRVSEFRFTDDDQNGENFEIAVDALVFSSHQYSLALEEVKRACKNSDLATTCISK